MITMSKFAFPSSCHGVFHLYVLLSLHNSSLMGLLEFVSFSSVFFLDSSLGSSKSCLISQVRTCFVFQRKSVLIQMALLDRFVFEDQIEFITAATLAGDEV